MDDLTPPHWGTPPPMTELARRCEDVERQPKAGAVYLEKRDDYWTADIDMPVIYSGSLTYHYGMIQCYGKTKPDAEALQARVLAALRAGGENG